MAKTVTSPWKLPTANNSNISGGPEAGAYQTEACSLADIMSEELAAELERKEAPQLFTNLTIEEEYEPLDDEFPNVSSSIVSDGDNKAVGGVAGVADAEKGDTQDDLMLAQLLQREFDREYEDVVKRQERHINKNDKVQVNFQNFKHSRHEVEDLSDSSDDDHLDDDYREFFNNKIDNAKAPQFPPSGVMKQSDGSYVTKHDSTINGRNNTRKAMAFAPGVHTGDAVGYDLKLPNHVYNALQRHSNKEAGRRARLNDKKDTSTAELAVDPKTRLILFKMVNNGMLQSITGSVSTGKEANVFHAFGGVLEDGRQLPEECALKIFKTTLQEFKNRVEYVKDDYRFRNPRKVLKIWAEKEEMNLRRMRRHKIRCPDIVKLRKHVLVMEFLGDNGQAAPKLRDVVFEDPDDLQKAYDQVVESMDGMYRKCNLIHADLSEFNILYHRGDCYIIDVSQAVDQSHPKSLVYLARDCQRVTTYFQKAGLDDILNPRELFISITDIPIQSDEKFLTEVQEHQISNRAKERRNDKKKPADCTLRKEMEDRQAEAGEYYDSDDQLQ